MKFRALFLAGNAAAVLLIASCQQTPPASEVGELRTIDNTPLEAMVIDPPPTTVPQPLETKTPEGEVKKPVVTTTTATATSSDESLQHKINLPFAPAIAMDPVDGGKVSIRIDTPTAEYKNKIYYFTSDGNRRSFTANPEQYVKGTLSRY